MCIMIRCAVFVSEISTDSRQIEASSNRILAHKPKGHTRTSFVGKEKNYALACLGFVGVSMI